MEMQLQWNEDTGRPWEDRKLYAHTWNDRALCYARPTIVGTTYSAFDFRPPG